ncbi:hypothetical protein H7X68_00160 [Candidatus Saccharibacteria bacterium]|nr:hypothetical protein [Candidatus Saccharibacteria bacterium]
MSIEAEPAVFILPDETNVRHLSLCDDIPECVEVPETESELRLKRAEAIRASVDNRREIVTSTVMLADVRGRMSVLAIEESYWRDRLRDAEVVLAELKIAKQDYRDRI